MSAPRAEVVRRQTSLTCSDQESAESIRTPRYLWVFTSSMLLDDPGKHRVTGSGQLAILMSRVQPSSCYRVLGSWISWCKHITPFSTNGPESAKTRLRVKIIFLRKMMFCKKVVSRGRSSACSEVETKRKSRFFEEVAVMAGRVSAVREVKGLPVEYSLLQL